MKWTLAALALLLMQLYFVFLGVETFGIYWNPVVLFITSMAIPMLYWFGLQGQKTITHSKPKKSIQLAWTLGTLIGFLLCLGGLINQHQAIPDPVVYSDVLPQIETLYTRFAAGEMPYYPVPFETHSAFPVYMPLHWLPVAIPIELGFDVRWIGYFLLVAGLIFYGLFKRSTGNITTTIISALLPFLVIAGYVRFGGIDLPVSLETLIAGYYLVLATGTIKGNTAILTVGLILCLLSRYTLIFWLPLFAWLFISEKGWKRAWLVAGIVVAAITLIYVLPFVGQETSILKKGVEYHNNAAIAEWQGSGEPPTSYSFLTGIYFAPHFEALFPGDSAQEVFSTRVVQAVLMIVLNLIGILLLRFIKDKSRRWEFAFIMLYVVMVCFYTFGPLTYRYYLITTLILAAIMVGRIIEHRLPKSRLVRYIP